MLTLKTILKRIGQSQRRLADACGISVTSMSRLIDKNTWPKRPGKEILQSKIVDFLATNGAKIMDFELCFLTEDEVKKFNENNKNLAVQYTTTTQPDCLDTTDDNKNNQSEEDEPMLLRKQTFLPETKKAFSMHKDPFSDLTCAEDMWLSPDIRYVRETMYQTAKHGGFLAVIGESGAGKSTLRRDLQDRIFNDKQPIILINPYVIAAEDNDTKGKTLKSTHVAESLLATVAPLASIKSSPEARFAQMHKALKDSHNSGYKHCLVIEEAHSLPIPTLKHLKRILELEQGFTKLVSVILIGQPELAVKLSERNAEVREVVQRCEVVNLPPIAPARVIEFLQHRFERVSKSAKDVITDDGIQALIERLTLAARHKNEGEVSQLYPLAIGNLMIAAMNLAAKLGTDVVDKDIVMGV